MTHCKDALLSTEAAEWPTRPRAVAAARRGDAPQPQPVRSYPISRWYLRPAAGWLAAGLAPTAVRPVHLTFCGLTAAAGATAVLVWRPEAMPLAAVLVLTYWFFDRADGQLARRQGTVSAWGAWFDANVDELADVALHVAAAAVVAARVAAAWPWWLLIAFLSGKYLLMYGLTLEEHTKRGHSTFSLAGDSRPRTTPREKVECPLFRRAYHLPGNADVRVHLFVLALITGYLAVELALVAVYYNLRWLVRYALVARRLGGVR
ncbi:MAG: CDP-alcohol phosphatidyltransferase family protein [Planctomycetota bacterium]|jgi:phosphatidylglycerophosphate synthase